MLSEEQEKVLPAKALNLLSQADHAWQRPMLWLIEELADALLSRQQLERRLEEARVTVKTVCNGLKSITRDALSVMDTQVALHAEMLRKDLAAAFADEEAEDAE